MHVEGFDIHFEIPKPENANPTVHDQLIITYHGYMKVVKLPNA